MIERDLFGHDVIRRDAHFVGDNRITLRRRWAPGPIACMIGHNPSDADANRDDPTCRWWIEWCRLYGFGGFVAVNLYPFVTADPRKCYQLVQEIEGGINWFARDVLYYNNLETIAAEAKAADQVFACWGGIARDPAWTEYVIDAVRGGEGPHPDIWCWGKTASGAPKHPMARGHHRIPRDQAPVLWRAAP